MTKKRQIAKFAAEQAARAAYKAIMDAPLRKVATTSKTRVVGPSHKEVAKIAAVAAYKAIVRLGQLAGFDPNAVLAKYPGVEEALYLINQGTPEDVNVPEAQADWSKLVADTAGTDNANVKSYVAQWRQTLSTVGVR